MDARVIAVGPYGERVIPIEVLYLWSGLTCLMAGELIHRIEIPVLSLARSSFEKFAVRAGDFAEASVAVRAISSGGVVDEIRISLGAVAPKPIRARVAEGHLVRAGRIDAAVIRNAAEATLEGALPLKDNMHKAHLLANLAERAIRQALQ